MSTIPTRTSRHALEPGWTTDDSADLYQVNAWGNGYFCVNDKGHVAVRPNRVAGQEIDLMEVVEGLRDRGLSAPYVLRFSDLLQHRLREIHRAFNSAIAENEYNGGYFSVYPIKVNQQRHLVEEVFEYSEPLGFGIEVGSKPELLAALGLTHGTTNRPIICNGFKDDRYIEGVILAAKLGRKIIPVVENFSELALIVKYAREYNVRPTIGVRVKLASQGVGRWKSSAGARSKFGLFVSEILSLLEYLKEQKMEDCLQLLHCHIGSQIHDIRRIKNAINELAHIYTELHRLGAGMKYLDVGGGLGVDYDGSQTNFESSMNYSIAEYAGDIIYRVKSVCDDASVPHPTVITESGRAMVAFNSVLVFNVLGMSGLDRFHIPDSIEDEINEPPAEIPQPIYDLFDAHREVSKRRLVECYHDAIHARDEAMELFNLGYMSLHLRSLAERLFWATCAKIRDACRELPQVPEELDDLEVILSDTYFCNFSVFQSIPDSWAVDQIFPIVPIHRLEEKPVRRAVLVDMTCDSDGKIDRFVDRRDIRKTIELHTYNPGEPYYIGAFLVGAYQETLGDLHNLFGDTHVVHIHLTDDGDWELGEIVEGDTVREVLSYVQYDSTRLHRLMRQDCERAVRDNRLTVKESRELLSFYESGLNGYTYLE